MQGNISMNEAQIMKLGKNNTKIGHHDNILRKRNANMYENITA